MKVLLVGSGGREHALAWKLKQSRHVTAFAWAPGNGGLGGSDQRVAVKAEDISGLLSFASGWKPDLVVVGPEAPLAAGLSDEIQALGVPCFGPTRGAARLESSKVFAKNFCALNGIATAPYQVLDSPKAARALLERYSGEAPLVLKADGLAAGKGVLICATREEALDGMERILVKKEFGAAGDRLLVEAFLAGEEASLMVFCDGERAVPMPPARDYKRAGDGDAGANTGGMGAYCPSARMSQAQIDQTMEAVVKPTLKGMAATGHPYRGVLYVGLILTEKGPQVLEFNCRFGDPETQVVLPRLNDDLVDLLLACANGDLSGARPAWREETTVTVVLCSNGYPGAYATGREISGVEEAGKVPGVVVFHAGTKREGGRLLTSGGRVLNVTALGSTVAQARERAYEAASLIRFEGKTFRTDIAANV
jgi:phosphoribosylamine--glycine ligase